MICETLASQVKTQTSFEDLYTLAPHSLYSLSRTSLPNPQPPQHFRECPSISYS